MVLTFRRHPIISYLKKCREYFIELALLLLCTAIAGIFAFYAFDMLWYLYIETPVGKLFIQVNPDKTSAILEILSVNYLTFIPELTGISFLVCITVSILFRFLHINRHFYLSLGMPGKIFFWGGPLSWLVGCCIQQKYTINSLGTLIFVSAFPTLIIFMSCFKVSNALIPEAGSIFSWGWPRIKKALKDLWEMKME